MSRFSSLFDALSDKKARFFSEKQIVNDMIYDYYYSMKKTSFNAVVLSGGDSGDAAQNVDNGNDEIVALKVRPVDIHGLALPDPCSDESKKSSAAYRAFLVAMHPTAYSVPLEAGTADRPSNGQIVECYFEEPDKYRKLRWRTIKENNPGNHNYQCAGILVGLSDAFDTGTPTILDVDPADPRLQTQQLKGEYQGTEVLNGAMSDEFFSPLENISSDSQANARLLTPAAEDFNRLAKAFLEDKGYYITVTDSYRSLERQVEMKRKQLSGQGNPAATPGTSKHGWGLAVDFRTFDGKNSKFESSIFEWLTNNAHKYNFYHPEWAAKKGSAPEAHHWEYNGDHGLIKK